MTDVSGHEVIGGQWVDERGEGGICTEKYLTGVRGSEVDICGVSTAAERRTVG